MARLELTEVQKLLKDGNLSETILSARRQDRRLKLHVEPTTSQKRQTQAFQEFLNFVEKIVVKEKFDTLKDLIRFPLATTEVCENILSKVKKIFDAEGGVIKFNFSNPELEQDFQEYRKEQDLTFWRTKGYDAFRTSINSFLVVDLKTLEKDEEGELIQETEAPEPYYNIVSVERVLHVEVDKDDNCGFIIFYDAALDRYIQMDDLYYRRFRDEDGSFILESESTHDLEYTPAKPFWSNRISSDSWEKENVLTASLGALDHLLLFLIGRIHLEMYSTWPILSSYKQDCNYKDEFGHECEDGYVGYNVKNSLGEEEYRYKECPDCARRKLFMPGTFVDVPARATNEEPDMLEAMKFIEAPVDTLKLVDEKVVAKVKDITYNTIGVMH